MLQESSPWFWIVFLWRELFMKNIHIYLLSIIISFTLLIVGYYIADDRMASGFIGIGCSVLAASLMAIFIENAELQREKKRNSRSKQMFFGGG